MTTVCYYFYLKASVKLNLITLYISVDNDFQPYWTCDLYFNYYLFFATHKCIIFKADS